MTNTKFPTVSLDELKAQRLQPEDFPLRPVVLVVDDEPIIADTLVAILSASGYVADAAYNGESALEMAQIIPPELLISDVVMPGMSGVSLAISMRQTCPDCHVLLFSGQAATGDILLDARKQGHDFNILAKPVHPRDLLAHAARLLASA
ncbi:MAG: response regulator [Terriglobia bacterium]|nr:response regulator [Terriglobia bacterium]